MTAPVVWNSIINTQLPAWQAIDTGGGSAPVTPPSQDSTVTALVCASTINWSVAASSIFTVTLNQNATLAIPSNPRPGAWLMYVTQDSVGSRTLTLPPGVGFRAVMGVAPVLSSAPGAIDILQISSGDGVTYDVSVMRNMLAL